MEIVFDWLGRETGSPVDRATFATLSIIVDGQSLSEVEDRNAKTTREGIRASAYHLAEWFAANWWRLRWEPEDQTLDWRLSHQLAAAGGGYAWPNITFSSDGEEVLVESRSSGPDSVQPVRHLTNYSAAIPVQDFEKAIDDYIDAVVQRLYEYQVSDCCLPGLWNEVRQERMDSALALSRKLEALMGFDPDTSPGDVVDVIQRLIPEFGRSAVEETAASAGVATQAALTGLDSVAKEQAVTLQIPSWHEFEGDVPHHEDASGRPWERARDAACRARNIWGLGIEPLPNDKLSDLFSIPPDLLADRSDAGGLPEMAAGFRNGTADRLSLVLDKQRATGRRFAFARLIGDHFVADEAERLLPATRCKTARQKFQRAFAQELLCPFEALAHFSRMGRFGDDEVDAAAQCFDVSPLLVRTTLVNRGALDRGALAD